MATLVMNGRNAQFRIKSSEGKTAPKVLMVTKNHVKTVNVKGSIQIRNAA